MSTLRFSTSISLMFRERPIGERFAAARAAGFGGVEIQVLAEGDPEQMAVAAEQAGIEVVLLNVGMGDFLGGGAGLSGVPGRESQFLAEFERALLAAQRMKARFLHLGPSRVPSGATRESCLATLLANVRAAVDRTAGSPATLLVEPLNSADTPDVLLGDVDAAAEWLRRHFAGQVWLMFDIYHVARSGLDVLEAFRRNRDVVRHVQFSDVPGRQEPGAGTLDFPALFRGLEAAGYRGWLGAEYFARRPTQETLGWFEPYRTHP